MNIEKKKILLELGLGAAEADTYLAMVSGAERVRDIMKTTGLKRPTVYYALSELLEQGLVRRTGSGEGSSYGLESIDRLQQLAEERRKEADRLVADTATFTKDLLKSGHAERPHVSFVEGQRAIQHAIMETLYGKEKTICVIAPRDNVFWQIGKSFFDQYVTERNQRGIATRSLWEKPLERIVYNKYYTASNSVRLLSPTAKPFETTLFLYDDRTMYLSSLKNGYCLTVTSLEHRAFMQSMFEGLWAASKSYKR